MNMLISMPSGGEIIILLALGILPLFFIFKAGQWYGQSKERKK